jgi:tetrahydromethanopterin S-methyltransferase subunit C
MHIKYLSIKMGTLGGAVAAVLPSFDTDNLIVSVCMAVIGAVVSFMVSLILKIYLKDRISKWLLRGKARSLSRKRKND